MSSSTSVFPSSAASASGTWALTVSGDGVVCTFGRVGFDMELRDLLYLGGSRSEEGELPWPLL